ncbi:sulfurtransferase [Brevibacillus ginsengisoli]|uniref:sulfurtransferase n=1 Tax=Brevibacillus ginsengisoli TaxID=363854 RepID=UPI003CE8811D
METSQTVVSAEWLHANLQDPNLVILDCRFMLGQPVSGRSNYEISHIPGAVYVDLEADLSGPKSKHGSRHPLPSVEAMTALFSQLGIDDQTTVIAYDDQDLAMAARLWWMLRYVGHSKVAVLEGGFAGWQKAGFPTTTEVTSRKPRDFKAHVQAEMLVTLDDVLSRDDQTVLIDSRARERYLGENETIDPKAGHIPGALNYFFKENLTTESTLLPTPELRKRFDQVVNAKEVMVYCGSGVTACVNLLALHKIGRTDAKLYLGSWSDYSSYELPVATKE